MYCSTMTERLWKGKFAKWWRRSCEFADRCTSWTVVMHRHLEFLLGEQMSVQVLLWEKPQTVLQHLRVICLRPLEEMLYHLLDATASAEQGTEHAPFMVPALCCRETQGLWVSQSGLSSALRLFCLWEDQGNLQKMLRYVHRVPQAI